MKQVQATRLALPEGYGVAQLDDKQWYPLKIDRYYSADYPDGTTHPETIWGEENQDLRYRRREDAVQVCWQLAQEEEERKCRKWEQLAQQSEVYPDRCVHYQDIIEETTGRTPLVYHWVFDGG